MHPGLILGSFKPLRHQAEDVFALESHARVNIWNGLGTGKMHTGAWLAQRWWLRGVIDEVILVAPSMCFSDWRAAFEGQAFPSELVEFRDCRPPNQEDLVEALSGPRPQSGRLLVLGTTYGALRSIVGRRTGSRYTVRSDDPLLVHLRGRRVAFIADESQAIALPSSQQSEAGSEIAAASRCVVSMTATPIGNPLQMRLWGMTRVVRPDVLAAAKVANFNQFKVKYGVMHDPERPFQSYPVDVHQALIDEDLLRPMAPYTVRRTTEECIDLPPMIRMRRTYRPDARVLRMMNELIEEDRTFLESGRAVTVENALVERLRTVELASGWLEDTIIHDGKVRLLDTVADEIDEVASSSAQRLVWCSRTRELLTCALVLAGKNVSDAMSAGTIASNDNRLYRDVITSCRRRGVGIIHGRTPDRDRESIQSDWRSGRIRDVCAHPGVAGAGLNWQHVKAMIYFSQPLGIITREQSEARVQRFGLKHRLMCFDLCMERGPDLAIAEAHSQQRNTVRAILDWMDLLARRARA